MKNSEVVKKEMRQKMATVFMIIFGAIVLLTGFTVPLPSADFGPLMRELSNEKNSFLYNI